MNRHSECIESINNFLAFFAETELLFVVMQLLIITTCSSSLKQVAHYCSIMCRRQVKWHIRRSLFWECAQSLMKKTKKVDNYRHDTHYLDFRFCRARKRFIVHHSCVYAGGRSSSWYHAPALNLTMLTYFHPWLRVDQIHILPQTCLRPFLRGTWSVSTLQLSCLLDIQRSVIVIQRGQSEYYLKPHAFHLSISLKELLWILSTVMSHQACVGVMSLNGSDSDRGTVPPITETSFPPYFFLYNRMTIDFKAINNLETSSGR